MKCLNYGKLRFRAFRCDAAFFVRHLLNPYLLLKVV
nr:MAG TPA: hypothetical protein [Bacteriophage sp.]